MSSFRRGGWRRIGLGGAVACALAGGAASAADRAAALAWSTYLRSGPGETFAAIDELDHDTPVAVLGCEGRWCRVSSATADGYVDRDALELPRTAAPQSPATAGCLVVGQADDRRPMPTRFCAAPPRP